MTTSLLTRSGFFLATSLAFSPILSGATIQLDRPIDQALGDHPSVLYYAMEDAPAGGSEGFTTSDSSGNNNHANLWAGNGVAPTLTTGRFGQGLHIVGTTGVNTLDAQNKVNPSLYRTSSTSLDLSGKSFTMGLWLKFDTFLASDYSYNIDLIGKGARYTSQPGYWFYLAKSSTEGRWGLFFSATNNDGVSSEVGTGIKELAISLDSWHHFGLSYDYGSREVIFYFDGSEVGRAASNTEIGDSNSSLLYLLERGTAGWSGWFDGTIDEAFITEGVHTFEAIPEPSSVALVLVGIGLAAYAGRYRKG